MRQLGFDFLNEDNYNINNFIPFGENEEAFYFLNRSKEDENILEHQIIFLTGGRKCGKTHLGQIWKQKHNAKNINYEEIFKLELDDFINYIGNNIEKYDYYLLDNLDENFDENKLFHLINNVLNNNSNILIISNFNILNKKFKIKDLKSRVNSAIHLKIKKLSKEIKTMLIIKLLADNQISLNGEILKYLTKKLKTDYEYIYNFIDKLVDKITENGGKINLISVKELVENF